MHDRNNVSAPAGCAVSRKGLVNSVGPVPNVRVVLVFCCCCFTQAPQAGEIIKFHVEDGKPVEYQQSVLEIVPFFGGHIVGNARQA